MWRAGRLSSTSWPRCSVASHVPAHSRLLTTDGRRLVLGIESSCDDSCAALVSAPAQYPQGDGRAVVHASVVLKQDHGATKGIEPLNATHGHSANLPRAIKECLLQGKQQGVLQNDLDPREIDAVAVTQGPGMASCLSQGLSAAKLLATLWSKPLLYVHHMVAHALTPLLSPESAYIRPPFLVFLLSGGHTQLVLCSSLSRFQILANTTDNSIGDAFDKAARALNIVFDWDKQAPGSALEDFARRDGSESFPMPIPVRGKAEFSYAGLKSTVNRMVKQEAQALQSEENRRAFAYAFQKAAFAQLQDKLRMVLDQKYKHFKADMLPDDVPADSISDVVLSGGVASNAMLRQTIRDTVDNLAQRSAVRLHCPPISLCTDNAAMIAHAGLIHWTPVYDLTAVPRARWSVEDFPGPSTTS